MQEPPKSAARIFKVGDKVRVPGNRAGCQEGVVKWMMENGSGPEVWIYVMDPPKGCKFANDLSTIQCYGEELVLVEEQH